MQWLVNNSQENKNPILAREENIVFCGRWRINKFVV